MSKNTHGYPEEWKLAYAVLEDPETFPRVFLSGPPGIGKTYVAYDTAPAGYVAVTLTPETPAAELRGHFIPEAGGFKWHHGPVVQAALAGSRLVLNEISHAGPDVQAFLYPILEDRSTSSFTLPTGEEVVPAEGFNVVATDNHKLEDLTVALQNRFAARLHLQHYCPDGLRALPGEIRALASQVDSNTEHREQLSLRSWMGLARALRCLEPRHACLVTFGEEVGSFVWTNLGVQGIASQIKGKVEATEMVKGKARAYPKDIGTGVE